METLFSRQQEEFQTIKESVTDLAKLMKIASAERLSLALDAFSEIAIQMTKSLKEHSPTKELAKRIGEIEEEASKFIENLTKVLGMMRQVKEAIELATDLIMEKSEIITLIEDKEQHLKEILEEAQKLSDDIKRFQEDLKTLDHLWSEVVIPELRKVCKHEWVFKDKHTHICRICGKEEEHDWYRIKPGVMKCDKCGYTTYVRDLYE